MKTDNSIIYSIRWDNLASETYLYGSSVIFDTDGTVKFANLLMPPGQIIRRWHSDVNYQAKRHEPQLPVLEEGENYEIRSYATCKPEGTVKLRLSFFDRQGEKAGSQIIDNRIDEFMCPQGASTFELELINAGAEELTFHHIEIQKKADADNNVRIINYDAFVYVLILEPTGSSYIIPEDRILNRFRNRVILTSEGADAVALNKSVLNNIKEKIKPDHLVVIGYGAKSNASADSFANKICSGIRLYTYGTAPKRSKTGVENIVYGTAKDLENDTATYLMAPLCDKTSRLLKLKFI